MTKIDIADLDCIYLSYDEPKKEEFWVKISNMVPWAKRVDGVKGIDSAHKEAARISETDRFIIIDGDNMPDPEFFNQRLELNDSNKDCVFRWKARNIINGLVYGNGGLSCWTKEFVMNMKTHENSPKDDIANQFEFCFDSKYISMNDCYSTTYPNQSPLQALRAGYREGCKLTTNRGIPFKKTNSAGKTLKQYIHETNYRNLVIWCTIGADVENGIFAITGARFGVSESTAETDIFPVLTDYEEFNRRSTIYQNPSFIESLSKRILGDINIREIFEEPLLDVDADQSRFFKFCLEPYRNKGINKIE